MWWAILLCTASSPLVLAVAAAAARTPLPRRRYAWVAVVACALAGAAAGRLGSWPIAVAFAAAGLVAIAAAIVDAHERRLPNVLVYPLLGAGVVVLGTITLLTGAGSPIRGLAGLAIFGGWLFIASLTGVGEGDVKLAAGWGWWLGWLSWSALFYGVVLAQIAITGTHFAGRWRRQRGSGGDETPLGPGIVAGVMTGLLALTFVARP